MVVYPSQLTSEEKALRKRFSKLQEKVSELYSKHFLNVAPLVAERTQALSNQFKTRGKQQSCGN